MREWYCPHQYGSAEAYNGCMSCPHRSAEKEDGAVLSHSYGAAVWNLEDDDRKRIPAYFYVDTQAYACNAPQDYVCPVTEAVKAKQRAAHEKFMAQMSKQYGSVEAYYEMLRKSKDKEEREKQEQSNRMRNEQRPLTRGNMRVMLSGETFDAYIDLQVGNITENEFQDVLKRNGAVWKEVVSQ